MRTMRRLALLFALLCASASGRGAEVDWSTLAFEPLNTFQRLYFQMYLRYGPEPSAAGRDIDLPQVRSLFLMLGEGEKRAASESPATHKKFTEGQYKVLGLLGHGGRTWQEWADIIADLEFLIEPDPDYAKKLELKNAILEAFQAVADEPVTSLTEEEYKMLVSQPDSQAPMGRPDDK